jgi:ArsR family metal-binding transcriptional regulator
MNKKKFVIMYTMKDRITGIVTNGNVTVTATSDKEAEKNFKASTTTKTFVGIRPA